MHVAELWRYPVKSMAGEALTSATIRSDGVVGDRTVYVLGHHGRIVTARTRPRLLGHRATVGPDGEPLVDGRPWRAPDVAHDVAAAAGPGAALVRASGLERFDILPLLVATDGAIAALGADGRRLRPNIVIGGVPGLAERAWEGGSLTIGSVVLAVEDLRQRCIMTTFHPDTLEQDTSVLRRINAEFGGRLALNSHVAHPGTIAVGDVVTFAAGRSRKPEAGDPSHENQ
ncbi:MAG TPA: MOSC N-terminal beta barrel domain-containing protein [Gemmatimonadales bacterium]|nr:MOSC N-terminal beta barrel domain-containing protein [Gemmatimonadales bacterium]